MSFRLAVVQPLAHPPPEDERNVGEAVRHVEAAAAQGALSLLITPQLTDRAVVGAL